MEDPLSSGQSPGRQHGATAGTPAPSRNLGLGGRSADVSPGDPFSWMSVRGFLWPPGQIPTRPVAPNYRRVSSSRPRVLKAGKGGASAGCLVSWLYPHPLHTPVQGQQRSLCPPPLTPLQGHCDSAGPPGPSLHLNTRNLSHLQRLLLQVRTHTRRSLGGNRTSWGGVTLTLTRPHTRGSRNARKTT